MIWNSLDGPDMDFATIFAQRPSSELGAIQCYHNLRDKSCLGNPGNGVRWRLKCRKSMAGCLKET